MHSLLTRQLKRLGLNDDVMPTTAEAWRQLLERISQSYTESDQGRTLLERSLAISSQEMQELLCEIQKKNEILIKVEQAQTRMIIDSALDAIVGMDQEGKIIDWNPQAEVVFGWSEQEVLGRLLSETIVPEEYRSAHDNGVKRFLKTGKGTILNQRFELWALHRDGHTFPIEIAILSICKDETHQFFGFVRDITERKQVEASLRKAKEQAESAAQMKSEFLATMSHEIRTPMNGVIGMTGLLLETELDSQQRQYAETVRNSSEALLTIINDILDFSKIEAGKLEFEVIDFDLRVALEESLDLVAEKAGEKQLELVGQVARDVPTALRGDPGRLRQVLLNLTSNAIKFTEDGEVTVKVHLLEDADEDVLLRLEVIDTGIGIPTDVQDRLFQPFSQADSSTTRRFGGTGLGLAISRQLVELMNGHIGVESAPNQGSTFWFTVRLLKQPLSVLAEPTASRHLHGLRLCCVDDHQSNLELLSQYADEWGMETMLATTPAEALALLQEGVSLGNSVDVAILDMEMPGMDGYTLARIIKADPRLASIRLVLLTSLGRKSDAIAAREAGFSGYLTKPVRKAQLEECLRGMMNQHSQGNELQRASSSVTRLYCDEGSKLDQFRILVADDHRVNQQLAVLMLERLGYRVDVVGNGVEAVEAMKRIPYSLVLMDCQMPEMDGYQATAEIRRNEAESVKREAKEVSLDNSRHASRVPIIAMTANAMPGDREKCLDAGMDEHIAKPIKSDQLEAMLTRWLPKQETMDEKRKMRKERQVTSNEQRKLCDERRNSSDDQHVTSGEVPDAHSPLLPEPIDEAVLEEWIGLGGLDFMSRMVDQFIIDATACVTALEYAIEQNDVAQVQEIAHGLKGICRNIGAGPLGDICCALEQQNSDQLQEGLVNTFRGLQAELQRVCDMLNRQKIGVSPPSSALEAME